MKKFKYFEKGFINPVAIGIIAVVVVVVIMFGFYAYPKKAVIIDNQQTELGDKPTEGQFDNTIDSSVNVGKDPFVQKISVNLSPEDKKAFDAQDALKSITFRWTPLVPKPQEVVTYRLKVWQLMQGQNGSQAMKTNSPVVTKDVDNVTEVAVSGIYTGPCKPPYLCDFIWNVEASVNQPGAVMQKIIGTSETFTFNVKEPIDTSTGTSGSTR